METTTAAGRWHWACPLGDGRVIDACPQLPIPVPKLYLRAVGRRQLGKVPNYNFSLVTSNFPLALELQQYIKS
jgi:hypothetical protein